MYQVSVQLTREKRIYTVKGFSIAPYVFHFSFYEKRQIFYIFFIFLFIDEQERVQKKTFTNWMNSYLKQVSSLKEMFGRYQTIKNHMHMVEKT